MRVEYHPLTASDLNNTIAYMISNVLADRDLFGAHALAGRCDQIVREAYPRVGTRISS